MKPPNNKQSLSPSTDTVPSPMFPALGVEFIQPYQKPEWLHIVPDPAELKRQHIPGLIQKRDGKRMVFLGFNTFTSWEQLTGNEKSTYACVDRFGKLVEVGPKNSENHASWDPIQNDPTFHYNLGTILANPDSVIPAHSTNPQALAHWENGTVLNFVKRGYVQSLDTPLSRRAVREYSNEMTVVTVKYGDDGTNYTLTSIVYRNPPDKRGLRDLGALNNVG